MSESRGISAYLHESLSAEDALAYLMRYWPGPGVVMRGLLRDVPLVYDGSRTAQDILSEFHEREAARRHEEEPPG